MNISNLIIKDDQTMKNCLDILNKNDQKIVLVVNNKGALIGTITDGDIRRSILNGLDLNSQTKDIMNASFFSAPKKISFYNANKIMRENDLKQLPIVNKKGVPIDVLLANIDTEKRNDFSIFILAGGEGKRLLPLTENCPKPMLKLNNKPMLELIIDKFKNHGFHKFYISVNYLKEIIINHFEDGRKFGVKIKYIHEAQKLGTAGSLSLIQETINKPLIVTNGDLITSINYENLLDYHIKNKNFVTIGIKKYISTIPFGVIKSKGNIVQEFLEKPSIPYNINAGIYILNPEVLNFLTKNEKIDMPDLIEKTIKKDKKVAMFPIHEQWQDIGVPEIYEEYKNKNF